MTQTQEKRYIIVVTGPEAIHPHPSYLSARGGLTSNRDTQMDPDDSGHALFGARRFATEWEALQELEHARTLRTRNPVYGDATFAVESI